MKTTHMILCATIALALAADTCWAQRPEGPGGPRRGRPGGDRQGPPRDGPGRGFHPPKHPLHTALDTNNDGEISAKEIKAASESLKKLDKNKDGQISLEEMRPQFGGRRPGEGGPQRGGPREGDRRGGDRGPRDGDRRGGERGPRDGDRREGGREGQGRPGGSFVDRLLSFDKNKDGKLQKDEMPDRLKGALDRVDTNKDGVLDRAELEQMAKRFGGGREGRGRGGERREGGDRPERPRRPGGDN